MSNEVIERKASITPPEETEEPDWEKIRSKPRRGAQMDTKDKVKSIVKEEMVASVVRILKRIAEIPDDEFKKYLLEKWPNFLAEIGITMSEVLGDNPEVRSYYQLPPSQVKLSQRTVQVPVPIGSEAPHRPKKGPMERSEGGYG